MASSPHPSQLDLFRAELAAIQPDPTNPHDRPALIAMNEALVAYELGNFAYGAVIVPSDDFNRILCAGQNRVFYPSFSPSAHAEVDVMEVYRMIMQTSSGNAGHDLFNGLTLFASGEPCPMCYAYLILSGVDAVYYISDDITGGMVHRHCHMPPDFQGIRGDRIFAQSSCSPALVELNTRIMRSNLRQLDNVLTRDNG